MTHPVAGYRILGACGLLNKDTGYVDFPIAQAVMHLTDEEKEKETDRWRCKVCYPLLVFVNVS